MWWIRRDLRLGDNPALALALAQATTVIPLFILDPNILNSPYHRAAHKRQAFLFGGLRQLDEDLRTRGSRLIVRRGQPLAVLSRVRAETNAAAILAAEDFSPFARRRDALAAAHLPLALVNSLVVHHPDTVVKADGRPYTVFTPFSRAWKARPGPLARDLLPAPAQLSPPPAIAATSLPAAADAAHVIPGEAHAREALHVFTQAAIYDYALRRNRLDGDGTSALSPYLRFGMISAREVAVAAQQAIIAAPHAEARHSAEAWLNELIWREFYTAILYHAPGVRQQACRPELRGITWTNDERAFVAWCQGRTGYPVVDAAMRQLTETGWMHNRARMIVASFLVKDLLIDWRWGEKWFMQHLMDSDPASNNGGWQWVAGVGTDASPFFRVFNPVRQSQLFDPAGDFARAWIPELRRVPDEHIHEPWTMSEAVQRKARCLVGKDYPAPIIDHAYARERALASYRSARFGRPIDDASLPD